MTDKLSRLVDVATSEYEYILINSFMNEIGVKNQYDLKFATFYLTLYKYAKELDVNWLYIHKDVIYLAQIYACHFQNETDINPKLLKIFYNIISDNINHRSIQSFYIRVLFAKISIKYNIF